MPDLDLIKQGEQAVRRPQQGLVRRIEVEVDDILHLVDKLLAVRQVESTRQMRLQPVRIWESFVR